MRVTLQEQLASVLAEVRQEGAALHEDRITSFSLITVRPAMSFSACARLASRTSATASLKFSRASSMVLPCVLAPGSSSTNPIHLSPSCSSSAPPAHTRQHRPSPPQRSSQASIPVSSSQPPFRISSLSTFLHHSLHSEHHAEPRLAAHHAIVGGSGLFEREGLHHGTNPRKGTKVERLFRVSGAA